MTRMKIDGDVNGRISIEGRTQGEGSLIFKSQGNDSGSMPKRRLPPVKKEKNLDKSISHTPFPSPLP